MRLSGSRALSFRAFLGSSVHHFTTLLVGKEVDERLKRPHHHRRALLGRRVLLDDLGQIHSRFQRFQSGVQQWIFRDLIGVQLQFDPFVQANPANLFDVAVPRPERQPV